MLVRRYGWLAMYFGKFLRRYGPAAEEQWSVTALLWSVTEVFLLVDKVLWLTGKVLSLVGNVLRSIFKV